MKAKSARIRQALWPGRLERQNLWPGRVERSNLPGRLEKTHSPGRLEKHNWPALLERKDSRLSWLNNPVVLSVVPKVFSQRKSWRWEPTYLMDQQISIPIILKVSGTGCKHIVVTLE